jgi:hypothetical protein
VATNMAPQIRQEVERQRLTFEGNTEVDLIFTGHSAGGAVAALVFAHCWQEEMHTFRSGERSHPKFLESYSHMIDSLS